MDFKHKLIPFAPPVPRARLVPFVVALVMMAAGISHMFTFALALDHVPWGDDSPFAALLAASALAAGAGLVLLSITFPRRLHHRVDLVTVANAAALGVGILGAGVGFLARSLPMSPSPHANNAAFGAGLLLSLSGAVAASFRAPRHVPDGRRPPSRASGQSGETW